MTKQALEKYLYFRRHKFDWLAVPILLNFLVALATFCQQFTVVVRVFKYLSSKYTDFMKLVVAYLYRYAIPENKMLDVLWHFINLRYNAHSLTAWIVYVFVWAIGRHYSLCVTNKKKLREWFTQNKASSRIVHTIPTMNLNIFKGKLKILFTFYKTSLSPALRLCKI